MKMGKLDIQLIILLGKFWLRISIICGRFMQC